jgi:cystathionine gamma-lyase
MRGFGGMISFYIKGGKQEMSLFLKAVKLFILAESLGGVESILIYYIYIIGLIECPALMTHGSVPLEHRILLGITDNLIRISVGIENVEDIILDLE